MSKLKLPPRFKIYHNVSEDYYFIKERFLLFFYKTRCWALGAVLPQGRYSSVEEAISRIDLILTIENDTPDEIELVKEV